MNIFVCENEFAFDIAFARLLAQEVRTNPSLNLGLSTGQTTRGGYVELARMCAAGEVSFADASLWSIDMDLGLPHDHPMSAFQIMKREVFDVLDVRPECCHWPDGGAEDGQVEMNAYVDALEAAGGLDVQVLALGINGHLGLNQPGSPLNSTRVVCRLMDKHVREVDGIRYDWGLTLGLADIMHARKLLFCAKGAHKADIVARALAGEVSPECPASVVQLHPNATVLLDVAAAAKLNVEGA